MPKLTTEQFLLDVRKRSAAAEAKVKSGINVNMTAGGEAHVKLDMEFEDENELGEAYLTAVADCALLLRLIDKGTLDG